MKTDREIKKDFDAVEMMRNIRNQIDEETKGMSFDQLKQYYRKSAEKNQKRADA